MRHSLAVLVASIGLTTVSVAALAADLPTPAKKMTIATPIVHPLVKATPTPVPPQQNPQPHPSDAHHVKPTPTPAPR